MKRSTCNGKQTKTEKEETLQELRKEQQRGKCSNWKEISEICKKQEKEENREGSSDLSKIKISDDESKKSMSSFAESEESGEILASSSEWKIGSDELFVTCLNDSDKIAKPIKITWIFLLILV